MNKLIVKTARHCLGMSLVIFSALAFAGAMKTVESTALGDSDIGEFYQFDDLSSKTPGVLLRQEPLDQHQSPISVRHLGMVGKVVMLPI